SFGHVLIIAGSRGFTGAVKMAAEGAGRSGAGLVTVAVPQPVVQYVAPAILETMWIGLPATKVESISSDAVGAAMSAAENKQAVVLGPGISTNEDTRRFVLDFVKQCKLPMLIDADGLNSVSINPGVLATAQAPVVVTPHPGEM